MHEPCTLAAACPEMARVQTFECASVHWRIGAITKDVQNACMHAPQSSRTHLNLHDWDGRRVGHTPAQSASVALQLAAKCASDAGMMHRSESCGVCNTIATSAQHRQALRGGAMPTAERETASERRSQIRNLRIEAAMHDPKMASRISKEMELSSTLGAHPSSLNSPIPDLHSLPLPLCKSEIAESRLQSTSPKWLLGSQNAKMEMQKPRQ